MNLEQISQQLINQDGKMVEIIQRFDAVDYQIADQGKQFNHINQRQENHDQRFDRIDHKFADHDLMLERIDAQFDQMVTKQEFYGVMDKAMTILKRLDQERVFTTEWIRRIENDLSRVKKILRLA